MISPEPLPLSDAPARIRVRIVSGDGDLSAVHVLRQKIFGGIDGSGADRDRFDAVCQHVIVENAQTGRLLACCRVLPLASGADMAHSYSAGYYDLSGFAPLARPVVEVGRLCIGDIGRDADVLRCLWSALAGVVRETRAALLFGCTSFAGTDPVTYADALSDLARGSLASGSMRAIHAGGACVPLVPGDTPPDPQKVLAQMPPLLRFYLSLGAKVSDHAVIDRDLGTLHVFTTLATAAISQARKRSLLALAG